MTWQPIETAPKDGRVVHLWADDKWPVPAMWEEYDETAQDELGSGYWGYAERLVGDVVGEVQNPTHWMPLPEPPK